MVDSSTVTAVELEEAAEPVTGELEVVEDSVEAISVEDSVEATSVVEAISVAEYSVEDTVMELDEAGTEAVTGELEVVEDSGEAGTEAVVLPTVSEGPVSAGEEGVGWDPVECSLVVCPWGVGTEVVTAVDLVTEKAVEEALVVVLEAELQSKEMVGMDTEQVDDSWGMLEPVWPLG